MTDTALPEVIEAAIIEYRDSIDTARAFAGVRDPENDYERIGRTLMDLRAAIHTALAEARVNGVIEGVCKVKALIETAKSFQTAQERIDVVKSMTDDDLERLRGEIIRLVEQEGK